MEQLALRNKYHCRKALSSIGFLLMGAGVLSIATGCEAIDEPPVTRDVSQAGTRADNPQAQQGQQSGQSGSFGRRGRLPPAPKVLAPQATSTPKPGTTPSSLPAGYSAPGAATSTAQSSSGAVPAAPYQTGKYSSNYNEFWREAEAQGLVVTDSNTKSPSEFTNAYLNQDYSDESTGFSGTTYSVVTDSGQPVTPTPRPVPATRSYQSSVAGSRYVTEDGSPYPELDGAGAPVKAAPTRAGSYQTASPEYMSGATTTTTAQQTSNYNSSYSTASAAPGSFGVHLASYKVAANARKGWAVLSRQHDILSGLEARISVADIPGRGQFLRLKAGPFTSRAAAIETCRSIAVTGDYCKVTNFDGVSF